MGVCRWLEHHIWCYSLSLDAAEADSILTLFFSAWYRRLPFRVRTVGRRVRSANVASWPLAPPIVRPVGGGRPLAQHPLPPSVGEGDGRAAMPCLSRSRYSWFAIVHLRPIAGPLDSNARRASFGPSANDTALANCGQGYTGTILPRFVTALGSMSAVAALTAGMLSAAI